MQFDIEKLDKLKLIKDLRRALIDLQPMVKNPAYLWNGRELKNFSLRPREAWANWLIVAMLRFMHKRDITFMEDDVGDGFIVDKEKLVIVPTEHVSALEIPKGLKLPSGEQRIINAINLKIKKGADYARNKILVVFFDGAGEFYRSRIRESIFGRHGFEAIFCVGLLNSGEEGYSYSVTEFRDSFDDKSITHQVTINQDFSDWRVTQVIQ